jgi:nicotinate-nucleotide adenylyltransferase
MRIGLFGGSFDPAHSGHAHVARTAFKRLNLHAVWWLVTPQNPLKARSRPLAERLQSARAMARGPAMIVTDLETRWGLRYSAETVEALRARLPGVRFVWIMGEDNLATFHRWRDWRTIMRAAPIAVVTRPRVPIRALSSPAFARAAGRPLAPERAQALPRHATPAWIVLVARGDPSSSTALRARR